MARGESTGWSGRANTRRNERQAKVEIRPQSGSRKNTKRWCRGVEGREHKPVCVDYKTHKRSSIGEDWKLLICTECNRELGAYMPARFYHHPNQKPPAWVT